MQKSLYMWQSKTVIDTKLLTAGLNDTHTNDNYDMLHSTLIVIFNTDTKHCEYERGWLNRKSQDANIPLRCYFFKLLNFWNVLHSYILNINIFDWFRF